ncbi:MAG: adenosylcobinamide-GDP ribazoletransferase [Sulfitobacter sp.]|nr:adenosylcobinamide-GDP ribazoletransferase [Sulfitobacter sp.]MDG1352882.1 adenosylcobinamide-GDP ribazoletransferase [Sulfitobacter sp.]
MDKSDPLRQLWLATVLLTRLPLPHLPQSAFAMGAQAVWAYPLVGLAVGATGAVAGQIALTLGLPVIAAAVLALAVMMLVTGAMHEDGLADVFDGFWGGFTSARRLEIMRDSQIGTYGVLALITVVALRVGAISALLHTSPMAIIAAAALSRAMMPLLMFALPHARKDGLSQSVGRPSAAPLAICLTIGALVSLSCLAAGGLITIAIALAVCAGVAGVAMRKIGGQTGDVLGATQQLSEAAILLTCTTFL